MLAYLRYFYIVSFLVVVTAALVVGLYFRSVAANQIIKNTTQQSGVNIAQSFSNNIWQRHMATLQTLQSRPLAEWAQDANFRRFFQEGMYFFKDVPLVKFSVFTPDGKRFFSTKRSEIIEVEGEMSKVFAFIPFLAPAKEDPFKLAKQGRVASTIIGAGKLDLSGKGVGSQQGGSYLRVLVPLPVPVGPDAVTPNPQAIAEIYYDITNSWGYLSHFHVIGTTAIIGFFSVLYTALFYMSRRTERLLDKQYQANIELTAAKAQAESESQEKSKFLANVSHELRTPLNAIIGFSQIIKDEVHGPIQNPQYKDYIQDINASGTHLLSLINDILDYSKAEADKLEVDTADIDLNKVMRSCLRLVSPRAEEAQVQLVENIPKEHLIIKADSKRMRQVLLNLLSNAVKFTPEGGKVTLSAKLADEGGLIIEVSDTGIGIAEKDISKAMSTFGQVDNKLSRRYEGTGLGLPLTKKLVEIMGGTFTLQSELGLGTMVSIYFGPEKMSSLGDHTDQASTITPATGA